MAEVAPLQPLNLDELWRKSRAGSRNVAGVSYQIAVAVHLLVAGRAGDQPIASIIPEGLEDIDCGLASGGTLYVQAKERTPGRDSFGVADVAAAFAHAAAGVGQTDRVALITNAELASGLRFTGWSASVADIHTAQELNDLAGALAARGGQDAGPLLRRAHLIKLDWKLAAVTRARLRDGLGLPPSVAGIVHNHLLVDMAAISLKQRLRDRRTAARRRPADVDAVVRRVLDIVDIDALDMAVRIGVAEPVDLTTPIELPVERFLAGVDVRPGHIAAELDVPRLDELQDVLDGLREDGFVLVVGPSGAGKSALLWRIARDIPGTIRPIRVVSLRPEHVPELVRYVRLQEPSQEAPVLVCADDLGKPQTSGWEAAADQLLEMPGVLLLGAARHEDFHPGLARGRARIVEPRLTQEVAHAIASTLATRSVQLHLDPGEAYQEAGGLLMEFLSLLLKGRRLEYVVGAQVDERLSPERTTEREVLRHVCAAHVIGLSLAADQLPALVGDAADLPLALARLANEHLIVSDSRDGWVGLHELRSEAITGRLHRLPPPTEVSTFARLMKHVAAAMRPHVLVRAAMRSASGLDPLADAAAEFIADDETDIAHVTELSKALGRMDAVGYARMCITVSEEFPTPGLTRTTSYGSRIVYATSGSNSPSSRDLSTLWLSNCPRGRTHSGSGHGSGSRRLVCGTWRPEKAPMAPLMQRLCSSRLREHFVSDPVTQRQFGGHILTRPLLSVPVCLLH